MGIASPPLGTWEEGPFDALGSIDGHYQDLKCEESQPACAGPGGSQKYPLQCISTHRPRAPVKSMNHLAMTQLWALSEPFSLPPDKRSRVVYNPAPLEWKEESPGQRHPARDRWTVPLFTFGFCFVPLPYRPDFITPTYLLFSTYSLASTDNQLDPLYLSIVPFIIAIPRHANTAWSCGPHILPGGSTC